MFVVPVSIRDDWLDQKNGSPSHDPVILWLGKLRRYKSPQHLIKALPAVRKSVPAARLVIAGRRDDLRYERELFDLVRRLDLTDAVEFRLDLDEDEKRDQIRSSRVLAVTSAVEGFGIVVLEANAFGLPVVASSGVPEGAVRDGFNGLRYKYADIADLSDRLTNLLIDTDLYSRLSKNARENARRFKWSRVGAEFEEVVRRAAAGRPS